jgi:hypothetical protein
MTEHINLCILGKDIELLEIFKETILLSSDNNNLSKDLLQDYPNVPIFVNTFQIIDSTLFINDNTNIYLYVLNANECDEKTFKYLLKLNDTIENIITKKIFVTINSTKEDAIDYDFIDQLKIVNINTHLIPIKNTYIYRLLYWYSKCNQENINTEMLNKLKNDCENEIKILVGHVKYRNCNFATMDLPNKIRLLFNKYDFESLYGSQMEENEFKLFNSNMSEYVNSCYNYIKLESLKLRLSNIKVNYDLYDKSTMISSLIDMVEKNKYIYDEIVEYLSKDYLSEILLTNNYSYEQIKIINEINQKIIDNWNLHIFDNLLININNMMTEKTIEKFISQFDLDLLDELKTLPNFLELVNSNVVDKSLQNLFLNKFVSFDEYLIIIERMMVYFNCDIDYMAQSIKFIKQFVHPTIINDYLDIPDNRKCNYLEHVINFYECDKTIYITSYQDYSDNVDKIVKFVCVIKNLIVQTKK